MGHPLRESVPKAKGSPPPTKKRKKEKTKEEKKRIFLERMAKAREEKKKAIAEGKPLKLKAPKPAFNWYRNGRWHKVYPMPGRTKFNKGDLCQFKPDLLDVVIDEVLETPDPDVLLYRVRTVMPGYSYSFSTYGNELVVLKRYKPKLFLYKPTLKQKGKPELVFKPKPEINHLPPVALPGSWKRFVPKPPKYPDLEIVCRMTYWCDFRNLWIWRDIPRREERTIEKIYWRMVFQDRVPPEFISLEWFNKENSYAEVHDKDRAPKGAGSRRRNSKGAGHSNLPAKEGHLQQRPDLAGSSDGGGGAGSKRKAAIYRGPSLIQSIIKQQRK